ncbi:hypothetical protein N8861_02070 [Porticoccus sp.]|nr:hypothetical protein [Porticoccus sp.]
MRTKIEYKRVLVCGCEVANLINSYTEALKDKGYNVKNCSFFRNNYYLDNKYDYEIRIWLSKLNNKYINYFERALRKFLLFFVLFWRFDIYIYIWNQTFLPFKIDLFLLRIIGKKVIVVHCGSDVRYAPIQSKIDISHFTTHYFANNDTENFEKHLRKTSSFTRKFFTQWLTELSGASIISMRSQATFQGRKSYFFRFPQIQISSEAKKAKKLPLIIHAPTDRSGKGTKYVLAAIDALIKDGKSFEFELIENKNNDYVLQRLKDADIVIDQPGPWFGRLGVESFASGCALISGNNYEYYGIKNESPAIQFDPNGSSLRENLEKLIIDSELRQSKMNAGFLYWQSHYSYAAFINYIEDIFSNKNGDNIFFPPKNHKSFLLKHAENRFQKFIIYLLYRSKE